MSEIDRALDTIKRLNFCGLCTTGDCHACERKHAKDMALSGLKELQQYRVIGTLDECCEAREKQNPMKVKEIHVDEYICPACGSENGCNDKIVEDQYCPKCGQAIYTEEHNI